MPRFYFHVFNGNGETHDDEGVELSNLDDARALAMTGIRSILRDEVTHGRLDLNGMLKVADDTEHVLMEIRFDEAVDVRHDQASCQDPTGGASV
ncbi:DUF6894 family protein [Sphingomonas montanisoli]|uniref:DUF6894 domain-containing protein n=1 Tax=Sphingomonas montanisoli TaxID=2606412 RepID=A0A5D9C7S6_9SPHN|nr:hypothetical protein [Sphingomonas montanisoli]TZG27182.1 hypothetical protein FYJ91_06030 [Sphingomonas montanisoli]